ncbi:aminodeoxychorismate synthase component I [Alteromonas gracilis]|uniref:aminodeoxychorismate synthase component I n=1 Tax=Alteromonas gracilis TaxID=1479524 RepID=UPI0030CF89A9
MHHALQQVTVTKLTSNALMSLCSPETKHSDLFNALFENVADAPWSLLLDTSGSKQSDGRYNIMAYSPALVIEALNGNVTLHNTAEGSTCIIQEAPFEAAEKYLHEKIKGISLNSEVDVSHLPFIVGIAGMAGYDTGRFYEALPSTAQSDYTSPDFSVGLYLYSLVEDTQTGEFYYCACDGSTFPSFTSENKNRNNASPFCLTSSFSSNLTKTQYKQSLDKINRYLTAGDCYQVNMAQRFSAHFEGSLWKAYQELRLQNCAPFSAYFNSSKGSIASISPERFLRVKDGIVETKPIKGTRPRFDDIHEDRRSAEHLMNAEKDRAENLMIVDLLRNDISKHCKPHSVNVPALFALESYQAVHHLVSTVVGELNNTDSPLTLLKSAFPGGSITGAPKIRAMEVIDELEPHRRHIYCGSIFYMGFREDMDSSICIRTLLGEDKTLYCWAGGGIVLDSVADDEYQETLDKVSKIIPVLEHFGKA